ncbi:MAG: hypothetical protein CMN30_06805 [Sandaracinus sp.]|nr:hypothetical protein [Sandaracinus sp.]
MRAALSGLALVLAFALALGCETEEPEVVPPADPVDHGEAPDPGTDPLGARIHAIGLERLQRYTPGEAVHRGELRRGQALAHPEVLLGTHCYVVVGVASEGLEELSLSILDPGGAPILQSPTRGEEVTIGLRDALCPIEPGIYKIRARAYRGEGDYAIRVYSQQAL